MPSKWNKATKGSRNQHYSQWSKSSFLLLPVAMLMYKAGA